jgi:hypothetical protein
VFNTKLAQKEMRQTPLPPLLSPDSKVVTQPEPYSPMDISPIQPREEIVRVIPPRSGGAKKRLSFVDEDDDEEEGVRLQPATEEFLRTYHARLKSKEDTIREFEERKRVYNAQFQRDPVSEFELQRWV